MDLKTPTFSFVLSLSKDYTPSLSLIRLSLTSILRQFGYPFPIAVGQRRFFGSRPSLYLPLNRQSFVARLEILTPYQIHGTPPQRVTAKMTRLMLGEAEFEIISVADIISPVRAQQHVGVKSHFI